MAREYYTMQVDIAKALIYNVSSWKLRKIWKKKSALCWAQPGLTGLIWKYPSFPYNRRKYYASRQRGQRKDNKRWNYLHLEERFPWTDLSCGDLEENKHSFVQDTNFAQTDIQSYMNLKSSECRKTFKKLIVQSEISTRWLLLSRSGIGMSTPWMAS